LSFGISFLNKFYEHVFQKKVKLLKAIPEIDIENVVIGQYVANKAGPEQQQVGYVEDKTVKDGNFYSI
jgi:glucose-6-phosphate 1-dehydrogenase